MQYNYESKIKFYYNFFNNQSEETLLKTVLRFLKINKHRINKDAINQANQNNYGNAIGPYQRPPLQYLEQDLRQNFDSGDYIWIPHQRHKLQQIKASRNVHNHKIEQQVTDREIFKNYNCRPKHNILKTVRLCNVGWKPVEIDGSTSRSCFRGNQQN